MPNKVETFMPESSGNGNTVISVTDTRVELQDVSGGGGGTDTLIFEKL